MVSTQAAVTAPFDRVPNEIIEHVAFFTATLGRPGPPTDLITLQLVSRRFASTLSTHTNPHFYVLIFKAKFDAEAYFRRLGPEAKISENVVRELKRRFTLLTRFKGLQHCFVQAQQMQTTNAPIPRFFGLGAIPGPRPSSPGEGDRTNPAASGSAGENRTEREGDGNEDGADVTLKTKEMLWMAYLMMLENDGLNERTLREYARLEIWLRNFWFDPEGASFATYAIRENLWPPNMEFSVLAMWLFWFLLKPGNIVEEYFVLDEQTFRSVVSILKLIALGAHKYPVTQPEWIDLLPVSPLRNNIPTSYGSYPLLVAPPLAAPAILSYLSLAPKSVNKADTFKNSPLAPSGIWQVLTEEALSAEEEDAEVEAEGGDGERAEGVMVDNKGKGKEHEEGKDGATAQVAEGCDTAADATERIKPVQEARQLDFHHVKLSFEWESEWKRALSLAKRGPQPGLGIGMGPFGVGPGAPAGGVGLGGMGAAYGGGFGVGVPAGAMGRGLGGGGGGGGFGAGANPRAQERETVRPTEAFKLGSLEGVWERLFTYTEFTAYAALLSGAPPPTLHRSLVARHQQTWKLREYHLLGPEEPNEPQSGNTNTNTNTNTANVPDRYRPLSMGDLLRAYLPTGVDISVVGGGQERLEVREPGRREMLVYHRCPGLPSVPTADTTTPAHPHPSMSNAAPNPVTPTTIMQGELEPVAQPTYQRCVREVLIRGEGHSAWGPFNLVGRVRPYDGFVILSKEYLEGDRGKWLYRGFLVGDKYGSFTGRWRDTVSPVAVPGYEGCFFMGRKRG